MKQTKMILLTPATKYESYISCYNDINQLCYVLSEYQMYMIQKNFPLESNKEYHVISLEDLGLLNKLYSVMSYSKDDIRIKSCMLASNLDISIYKFSHELYETKKVLSQTSSEFVKWLKNYPEQLRVFNAWSTITYFESKKPLEERLAHRMQTLPQSEIHPERKAICKALKLASENVILLSKLQHINKTYHHNSDNICYKGNYEYKETMMLGIDHYLKEYLSINDYDRYMPVVTELVDLLWLFIEEKFINSPEYKITIL